MQKSTVVFVAVITCAAAFVARTAQELPSRVASHFRPGGRPDSFMPRDAYETWVLALVVGLPILLVLAHSLVRYLPARFVNLPNREHWLAPERRAETADYLHARSMWFGALLSVFMAYVHWQVVRANARQPPELSEPAVLGGLACFLVALGAWLLGTIRHFRRPS